MVEESWPPYELVNIQIGLNAWLAAPGRSHQLVGLTNYRHREFGLSDLLQPDRHDHGPTPGNVSWSSLASRPDRKQQAAVRAGLYLVRDSETRVAVLVLAADPESGMGSAQVHPVADRPGAAESIAAEIRGLAVEHNVFRGQVVSFGQEMFGERGAVLQFHARPDIADEDVILPPETMAMIRRQVVGVAEHRERLLAAHQQGLLAQAGLSPPEACLVT